MTEKNQKRLKMALYASVLLGALLIQTSVFGTLHLRAAPSVIPIAVLCIGLAEGSEKGCIFGLLGACLWAWSSRITMYDVWLILILPVIGMLTGLTSERFLLTGIKTALTITIPALFLTDGLLMFYMIFNNQLPISAFFTAFIPGLIYGVVLCAIIHPITNAISRIGGFHG